MMNSAELFANLQGGKAGCSIAIASDVNAADDRIGSADALMYQAVSILEQKAHILLESSCKDVLESDGLCCKHRPSIFL